MLRKKAWILTKQGMKLTTKCAAGISVGLFCYEVLPNTVLLPFQRARQEEQMESRIGLKDIPYQVQEYVRRTIDDLGFKEDQRKALSVYLADSHQVETLGNVNSLFGTLVKLPWSLWNHYPIPDTVPGEEGEKNPEATKEYLESLQWSDKAKLYFTAYQVAWTTKYQFYEQGAFNAIAFTLAFMVCYTATFTKYAVSEHHRILVIMNFLFLTFFYVAWMFATDFTTCKNEEEIMKSVFSLGREYTEGAIELYKKLQQHNRALREMTGFYGMLKYSEEGNTKSPRRITLPLNERIALAEEYLKKYESENDSSESKENKRESEEIKSESKENNKEMKTNKTELKENKTQSK